MKFFKGVWNCILLATVYTVFNEKPLFKRLFIAVFKKISEVVEYLTNNLK